MDQEGEPQADKQCSKCQMDFSTQFLVSISEEQLYCEDCLEQQLAFQQKQIKNIEQRYIFYKQFQSSLDENEVIVENKAKVSVEIEDQREIQRLDSQLQALEDNISKNKIQCESLRNNIVSMENEQEKFWEQINRFDKRAVKLQEKALSAKFDKQSARNQIQKIGRTSIIHSFVNIEIDDNLGYVWGLPMGKRAENSEMNWQEINAGLGHLCMALNFLGIKYGFKYSQMKMMRLKGSLTEILLQKQQDFLPLGYVGREQEKMFGRMLEALLVETYNLSEQIKEVEKIEYSEEMRLPFKVDSKQRKIGEYFIDPTKLEERTKWAHWTKAMRYYLINFKHILTIYSLSDPFL